MRKYFISAIVSVFLLMTYSEAKAGAAEYTLEIKDHKFSPTEIKIPKDQKVKLIVKNLDSSAEEFESFDLDREKIIKGGKSATIFIGPLNAGKYEFFGEFNPKTARGFVIVE